MHLVKMGSYRALLASVCRPGESNVRVELERASGLASLDLPDRVVLLIICQAIVGEGVLVARLLRSAHSVAIEQAAKQDGLEGLSSRRLLSNALHASTFDSTATHSASSCSGKFSNKQTAHRTPARYPSCTCYPLPRVAAQLQLQLQLQPRHQLATGKERGDALDASGKGDEDSEEASVRAETRSVLPSIVGSQSAAVEACEWRDNGPLLGYSSAPLLSSPLACWDSSPAGPSALQVKGR